MPNNTLRLAKNANHWHEIDQVVNDCVRAICARYDDPEQVRSFLTLLDLTTNPDYAIQDRQNVAFEAERAAFHFTRECEAAQSVYMESIRPLERKAKTA